MIAEVIKRRMRGIDHSIQINCRDDIISIVTVICGLFVTSANGAYVFIALCYCWRVCEHTQTPEPVVKALETGLKS